MIHHLADPVEEVPQQPEEQQQRRPPEEIFQNHHPQPLLSGSSRRKASRGGSGYPEHHQAVRLSAEGGGEGDGGWFAGRGRIGSNPPAMSTKSMGGGGGGNPVGSGSRNADDGQQYCLRWNNHRSNLLTVFEQLLQTEAFTDVTLAVGGTSIKCHKMVLAACSSYFQSLFLDNAHPHPIVVFKVIFLFFFYICKLTLLMIKLYIGHLQIDFINNEIIYRTLLTPRSEPFSSTCTEVR